MLSVRCIKCNKDFRVSGADFDERKKNKMANICPACIIVEGLRKEEGKSEKVVKIEKKKTKEIDETK